MPDDQSEARDAALRAELEGVKRINEVVEGVLSSLEKAKSNMGVSTNTEAHLPT